MSECSAAAILLQPVDRQLVSHPQGLLVVMLVDDAMSSPRARASIVTVGGETPLLAHKAERGDARQPCKPLSQSGARCNSPSCELMIAWDPCAPYSIKGGMRDRARCSTGRG